MAVSPKIKAVSLQILTDSLKSRLLVYKYRLLVCKSRLLVYICKTDSMQLALIPVWSERGISHSFVDCIYSHILCGLSCSGCGKQSSRVSHPRLEDKGSWCMLGCIYRLIMARLQFVLKCIYQMLEMLVYELSDHID